MSKLPPVPPANRSNKGTGSAPEPRKDAIKEKPPKNLREQGEQGNIKQNTTNQGYQQDR
jgi:hypothetical protein